MSLIFVVNESSPSLFMGHKNTKSAWANPEESAFLYIIFKFIWAMEDMIAIFIYIGK